MGVSMQDRYHGRSYIDGNFLPEDRSNIEATGRSIKKCPFWTIFWSEKSGNEKLFICALKQPEVNEFNI